MLLLKTAICDDVVASGAWQEWNRTTTLDTATSAEVRLLASAGAKVARLEPNSRTLAKLRGAKRYIYTRTQVTLAAVRPLLTALAERHIRMMLIKGAARIAEYPSAAAERTLRDVDILVHHEDLPAAISVIEASGWTARLSNIWEQNGGLAERFATSHAIGLAPPDPGRSGSLDLHHFVVPMCRNLGDDDRLWHRSRHVTFQGLEFRLPSTTDSAMISLTHAMLHSKGQKTADWALDVAVSIDAGKIDWSLLLNEVHERQIEAFVMAPLLVLANELQRTVPPRVLDSLAAAIDATRLAEFEYLATGYFSHAKSHRHVDAARQMAVSRAAAAARKNSAPRPISLPSPRAVPRRLGRGEMALVDLPQVRRDVELVLEVSFRPGGHWGRSSLLVRCPGLILAMWRRDAPRSLFASIIRRRLVLHIPASLFAMRRITTLGIQAGARNKVSELSLRWIGVDSSG